MSGDGNRLAAWIWLQEIVKGVRFHDKLGLLDQFAEPDVIFREHPSELSLYGITPDIHQSFFTSQALDQARAILDRHLKLGIRHVTRQDPLFRGGDWLVLYYKGSLSTEPAAAVVGTRQCSAHGYYYAQQVCSSLVSQGFIININLAYSKYYNKKYHCSCSIFGQRYRAFTVGTTSYLLQLILYIANNPVKAGLVKHPSEYRWCAHMDVVSRRSGIVSAQQLFEIIGGTAEKGAKVYDELIRQNIFAVSQVATESAFVSERRADQLEVLLDEMIGDRTSIGHIRSGSRDTLSILLRREFIGLATSQGYKTAEIARLLNVTDRCVRAIRAGDAASRQVGGTRYPIGN